LPINIGNLITFRAFPTHFVPIVYFTSSKSHFFSLAIHFYKTPSIPFFILHYIILKYYKIILFLYFFFHTPTKPTATIKTPAGRSTTKPRSTTRLANTGATATTGATTTTKSTTHNHHRAHANTYIHSHRPTPATTTSTTPHAGNHNLHHTSHRQPQPQPEPNHNPSIPMATEPRNPWPKLQGKPMATKIWL
jgi:hypothetical protein